MHTIIHQIGFSVLKTIKKTACTTTQIQSSNPENSAWTTSQIQHVIHSNNHIENSTKFHFHGPKKGNNQRGKIPHLLKCVGPVLDPPKSENNGGKASSSFSSFLSFFLSFSLFFLLLFSTNCLESLLQLQSWFDLGGVHLTQICLTLGQLKTKCSPCPNLTHFHAHA